MYCRAQEGASSLDTSQNVVYHNHDDLIADCLLQSLLLFFIFKSKYHFIIFLLLLSTNQLKWTLHSYPPILIYFGKIIVRFDTEK